MKFIDWFAGVGGFRRGLELAGHECVGFCEYDKFAVASYTSMHLITEEQRAYLDTLPFKERQKEILKEEYRNGEWYASDIRTVDYRDVPRADIWCFGAPCQDFSIAGSRSGLSGDRSSLVRRIFDLVRETDPSDRPKWLIYENVKGMLSSNKGRDYLAILMEMDDIGYDIEWQNLNTKYFGPPQNRERIYTVGHLRNRGLAKIFPIKGTDRTDSIFGIRQSLNSINVVGTLDPKRHSQMDVVSPDGIHPALTTLDERPKVGVIIVGNTNPSGKGQNGNCYLSDGYNPTLTCNKNDGNKIAIPVLTPDRGVKKQNGKRTKEDGEPSYTLTAKDIQGIAVKVEWVNAMDDGTCRTLKNQYQKNSAPNFMSSSTRGATAAAVNVPIRGGLQEHQSWRDDGISPTLTSSMGMGGGYTPVIQMGINPESDDGKTLQVTLQDGATVHAVWYPKKQCYIAIRRLTPRECFRLQGWTDDYFDKAEFVNSNSQLYKQAGNGVTVQVVEAIGKRLKEIEEREEE